MDETRWDRAPADEVLSPLASVERYFREFPWNGLDADDEVVDDPLEDTLVEGGGDDPEAPRPAGGKRRSGGAPWPQGDGARHNR